MKISGNIPIRNIYYMLTYAYKNLSFEKYEQMDMEKYENLIDFYSEILSIGVTSIIRGGLAKDYINIEDKVSVVQGKIDVTSSIKQNTGVNKKIMVSYDNVSEDILMNQLLKGTLQQILYSDNVSIENRNKISKLLPYFSNISEIELKLELWQKIRYTRNNKQYEFMLDICKYLYQSLLFSRGNNSSNQKVEDTQLAHSLYEKFIYSFYTKETKYKVTRDRIEWDIDDTDKEGLPIMRTDIVLKNGNQTLIVDSKFYEKNMSGKLGNNHISSNLYQIFAYVNNWKRNPDENVSGLLLYVKTLSDKQPNHHYTIKGDRISVLNLDLSQEFKYIRKDLLEYAEAFLNIQ